MKLNDKARGSDDLDDDACVEILLRLPVKSVTRFKSVSKRWLSLISAPHFRRHHTLRRHKPPPSLIIASHNSKFLYFNPCDTDTANPTKMIPFTITRPNYPTILSSCNGLLLLYNHCTKFEDLHVYNPATKQSRELTLAHNDEKSTSDVQFHLVYDPVVSIHYKIVCIRAGLKRLTYQIEVFDSASGTWNVCKEPITNCSHEMHRSTAPYYAWMEPFTNYNTQMQGDGFGSTVPYCSSNMIFGISSFCGEYLYCFDIDGNTLSFFKRPTLKYHILANPERAPHCELLQVSNGCVYYVSVQFDCKSVALWELQLQRDDPCRSLWLLKYHRTLSPPRCYAGRWSLLRLITETSTLLIHVYGNIVAYNFLDESYSELLDDQRSHLSSEYFHEFSNTGLHVHQFAETLALL